MRNRVILNPIAKLTSPLTRAEFLRVMGGAALGVAARVGGVATGLFAAADALAVDTAVDVFPTGTYPTDFLEVSAAINGGAGPSGNVYPGGGTVRLKATDASGTSNFFHFGDGSAAQPRLSVEIVKDVVVLGEMSSTVPSGLPVDPERDAWHPVDRTVIFGGFRPFACRSSAPAPTVLAVRGLYFVQPAGAAVQVKMTAGLEVSDCIIYDVKIAATGGGTPPYFSTGVEATGLNETSPMLTGVFRVLNNRIWRRPPTPTEFSRNSAGIVVQVASMAAEIRQNEVTGFPYAGIGIDRNAQAGVISDNRVVHCGYGPLPVSAGIAVGAAADGVVIERNEIVCGVHGPGQLSRRGITVASNSVLVKSNTVSGEAQVAGLWLTIWQTISASNCTLQLNGFSNLTAGVAQLQIDERCNFNRLIGNEYGDVDVSTGSAGALINGSNNQLTNETFWGSYTLLGYPTRPCVWLTPMSSYNLITALKFGTNGSSAICTQVLDQGVGNKIAGIERCPKK